MAQLCPVWLGIVGNLAVAFIVTCLADIAQATATITLLCSHHISILLWDVTIPMLATTTWPRIKATLIRSIDKILRICSLPLLKQNFALGILKLASKQTLFSGLPHHPLPVPNLFTMDIMHLTVLNDPDLFLKLFTGRLNVYKPDDKSTWDWAVFYKNDTLWKSHGETVVRAVPFIPSSFRRAPRDPFKKLNTGYKAWEFQQYIYGLGPTLLRHLLPCKYWLNFCKLVAGVRILQCHSIAHSDLLRGHSLLTEFAREYEDLYYQRMEACIHFMRQSIHLLTHMGPETF